MTFECHCPNKIKIVQHKNEVPKKGVNLREAEKNQKFNS